MEAINSLNNDIDFAVNPLVIILAIHILFILIARRRGWGWAPVQVFGGFIGVCIVIGILTGLGVIPDGVDIFTVLFGSIGVMLCLIYMIMRPKKR